MGVWLGMPEMSPEIRAATNDDIDAVARVIRVAFLDGGVPPGCWNRQESWHPWRCSPEWVKKAMESGHRFYVLEHNGMVCGCVGLHYLLHSPDGPYLTRLSVIPESRCQGFGKALVLHALEQGEGLGAKRVEIVVDFAKLVGWYEKEVFPANTLR